MPDGMPDGMKVPEGGRGEQCLPGGWVFLLPVVTCELQLGFCFHSFSAKAHRESNLL